MNRDSNPFSGYARPVEPGDFQGRKDLINFIIERLDRDAPVSIVGERRIGKTSLLRYLMSSEAAQAYNIVAERYLFVYIDMLRLSEPSPMDFWLYLLKETERLSGNRPWIKILSQLVNDLQSGQIDERNLNFLLDDLFARINRYDNRVVFLLDEFDHITSSEKLSENFFTSLRSHAIDHVTLIIASRSPLHEVCRSDVRASPFFNVFAEEKLIGFTNQEFNDWLDDRLEGSDVSFSLENRKFIIELTGWHPFFSDVVSRRLFNRLRQKNILTEMDKRDIQEDTAIEIKKYYEDYWEFSSPVEQAILALLSFSSFGHTPVLRKKDLDGDRSILSRLVSRALVLRDDENYFIFSSLFAEFVSNQVRAQASDKSFDEFVAEYVGKQPKTQLKKGFGNLKTLFTNIDPRFWGLILDFLTRHKNPDALLQGVIKQLSG